MSYAPSTPWDIEIDRLQKELGCSWGEARDMVICHWLQQGDTRPLAAALLSGDYCPSLLTSRTLAYMLPGVENLPAGVHERAPFTFALKARSKHAGRRPGPENATRDRLLAENVDRLRRQGVPYKVAIAAVEDAVRASGGAIGVQTIRDAYDAFKGKKSSD